MMVKKYIKPASHCLILKSEGRNLVRFMFAQIPSDSSFPTARLIAYDFAIFIP